MPFTQTTFLGASVRGFNSSIGWNLGQPSTLNVQLVVDPANGDAFAPVEVGTPIYFQFSGFRFFGLLQRWEKRNDTQGFPSYEVTCVDPREILEGAQVLMSGYSSSVGTVKNLLNVYGYWESQGFGLSYSNEAGIPWVRVRDALAALTTQPAYTDYGGPLTYRGIAYSLDLSQLPAPPDHYRVGESGTIGLLDLVAQICEDGGCDFFVELEAYTIRVRTVSRRDQPPLGTITELTDTNYGGTVVRSNNGLEARNETTSAFLVGGQVCDLHMTEDLTSFWGYDLNGSPILGENRRLDLLDDRYTCQLKNLLSATADVSIFENWTRPNNTPWPNCPVFLKVQNEIIRLTTLGLGNVYTITRGEFGTAAVAHTAGTVCTLLWNAVTCDHFTLNASPVADVIGSTTYPCTTFELRLAKAGFEAWSSFIVHYRPTIANFIGLTSPIRNMGGRGTLVAPNAVNDGRANAVAMGANAVLSDLHAREMRMYEFVKGYADEYMGKKYAVALPVIEHAEDPETLKASYSYEVTDGGYLPEDSEPLGLSNENQDAFKNQDGRFRAFCLFDDLASVDLSQVSPDGTVIENDVLFMEVQAAPLVVFTPTPAAIITLSGALTDEPDDAVGDVSLVAAVLQMTPAQAQQVFARAQFGNVNVKLAPNHHDPVQVAIPLKSNRLTYGPWYVAGAAGRTRFEQDPSLVPWNYGGYATMDAAAYARVTESVTNMQVSEAGSIEFASPPAYSLGDTLQAGGPNVTNVQVSFGTNGVTTNYSFQTYTPRFGVFSKGNTERMRRLATTGVELRRSLRAAGKENAARAEAIGNAARAARVFLQNAPPAVRRQSPHDTLVAYSFQDNEKYDAEQPSLTVAGSGYTRVGVSTATMYEAVAFANADVDESFQATAVMSWSGLVRPFTTNPSSTATLPKYVSPHAQFSVNLSKAGLDPWKAENDIEVYTHGNEYSSLHAFRDGAVTSNARVMALRGPLVVSGWGWDVEARAVPENGVGGFLGDYLKKSNNWKTGPVDLVWDERRGVWTSHDVMVGVANGSIPALGSASGAMTVYKNGSATSWVLGVYNWGPIAVSGGTQVYALYNATEQRWYAAPANPSGAPDFITYESGSIVNVYNSGTTTIYGNTINVYSSGNTINITSSGNVPSGDPYTVLWKPSVGDAEFNGSPVITEMRLGGNDVGTDGTLKLGRSTNANRTDVKSAIRTSTQTIVLPDNDPANGDLLTVKSFVGGTASTEWKAPSGILGSSLSGLSVSITMLTGDIACEGSGIRYGLSQAVFTNGLLTSLAAMASGSLGCCCVGDGSGRV